jgi:Tfp pilus assembly protein PilO
MSEKSKKVLLVGLIVGGLLLIGCGYYWFMFGRKTIDNERTAQAAAEEQITAVRIELIEINKMLEQKEKLKAMKEEVARAAARLPSSQDAEGFLGNVVSMLEQSSMNQQMVMPDEISERSTYTEIPWTITGLGQYFEIGPFFNMVELNPKRFMRVKEFTLENNAILPGYHPVRVQIGTFMFNK